MIEAIARLIKESGASQVQLNISVNDQGAHIVLNTKLGDIPANANKDIITLRNALSRPLAVAGDVGELDVTFTQQLEQYIDTIAPAAATLSNLNDVKGAVEAASKSQPANKASKKAKAASKTVSVETAPVVTPEKALAFEENVPFDDEADSL